MSISFSVTAYNEYDPTRARGERLMRALSSARAHPDLDEILVVDDGSDDFAWLTERMIGCADVKLYHNETNLGVFLNKIESVAQATSDWVILCDSDNHKDLVHIGKVLSLPLDPNTWYCPSFAKPAFNYRCYIGEYDLQSISRFDEGGFVQRNVAKCCLNTGNQVVHRATFLSVFEKYRGTQYWLDLWELYKDFHGLHNINVHERPKRYWRQVWDANDSLLLNSLWLYAGKKLSVVDGLEYEHHMAQGKDSDASNYNRSPPEKGPLNEQLLQHLIECAEAAKQ